MELLDSRTARHADPAASIEPSAAEDARDAPIGTASGQMKAAGDTPKRLASALACRALISRLPLNTSLTFDCDPKSSARSV